MKKLTDQELDSLFKAASEGYQPNFDAAAWEAMAEKFNQPKPALWKKWMPFALVSLIIFSTGVWVGINFNEGSDNEAVNSELKNQVSTNEKVDIEDNSERQLDSSPETKQDDVITHSSFSKGKSIGGNKFLNSNHREIFVTKENSDPIDVRNDLSSDKISVIDMETRSDFKTQSDKNQKVTTLSDEFEKAINPDTTHMINSVAENEKTKKSLKQLFIRALASPDLSSISYEPASGMGSNYALLGEYNFSNRWSVSTGVIWSLKKYSTNDEVVYSGYSADQLDGACRILDIPINVYYRFHPHTKLSFYAGLGLSSYIMMTEDYTYTVFATSGDRIYTTQVEGKNNEWFKVLNLSVGIQYPISSHWHIQAEPFLKAPLAGIGEGDVLLSSLGVFLGLKYKINLTN